MLGAGAGVLRNAVGPGTMGVRGAVRAMIPTPGTHPDTNGHGALIAHLESVTSQGKSIIFGFVPGFSIQWKEDKNHI